MPEDKYLEVGKAYIISHLRRAEDDKKKARKRVTLPFVTISREKGAGGSAVIEKLAQYLNSNDTGRVSGWTVFDKNLIQKVIEDHNLLEEMARLLPESRFSHIEEVFEELFGMHPSKRELVLKVSHTVYRLAEMGNVILVGRGSNIITRNLPGGFHVRLFGSVERRVQHLQESYGFTKGSALKMINETDADKKKYLKNIFGKDINSPLLYDLTINTDHISCENAAELIGGMVLKLKNQ
jgi:cytidylate kinase